MKKDGRGVLDNLIRCHLRTEPLVNSFLVSLNRSKSIYNVSSGIMLLFHPTLKDRAINYPPTGRLHFRNIINNSFLFTIHHLCVLVFRPIF